MTVPYLLVIDQGVDLDKTLLWQKGTPLVNVNLTGATAKCQVRSREGVLLATFQTSDGTLVLGGTAGTVRFAAPASVTTGFSWTDTASYDMIVTLLGGAVVKPFAGPVSLIKALTA